MVGGERGSAVSSVRVEGGRFRGAGSLIILENEVRDVTISGCILDDGLYGLALHLTNADPVADIVIRNNTFYGLNHWITFSRSRGDLKNMFIERNLILDCNDFHASSHDVSDVGPRWFKNNVWQASGRVDADFVARTVDAVPLISTDSASPDYLRPSDPSTVSVENDARRIPPMRAQLRPGARRPRHLLDRHPRPTRTELRHEARSRPRSLLDRRSRLGDGFVVFDGRSDSPLDRRSAPVARSRVASSGDTFGCEPERPHVERRAVGRSTVGVVVAERPPVRRRAVERSTVGVVVAERPPVRRRAVERSTVGVVVAERPPVRRRVVGREPLRLGRFGWKGRRVRRCRGSVGFRIRRLSRRIRTVVGAVA